MTLEELTALAEHNEVLANGLGYTIKLTYSKNCLRVSVKQNRICLHHRAYTNPHMHLVYAEMHTDVNNFLKVMQRVAENKKNSHRE